MMKLTKKNFIRCCQIVKQQVRYQTKEAPLFSSRALVELSQRGLVEVDGDDSFK